MKIEDAAGHRICAFWKKFNDAARLTVVRKKSDVSHLSDLCDGTDKGERHLPVWPRLAVTRKQIDLVSLFRVFLKNETAKRLDKKIRRTPNFLFLLIGESNDNHLGF